MSRQAPVDPNPPSSRRVKVFCAATVFYAFGVLSMFGTRISPDTTIPAAAVLVFFALGILAGLTGGILLGRGLYTRLRARPRGLFPFILLAALNVIVFVVLGKPSPTVHVGFALFLFQALCIVGAPFLLAANAYLLGFFFVPGGQGISGARRAILIPLLYGSLAVGILAGWNTGMWQRGSVPLESNRPTQRWPTFEESLREFDRVSPPLVKEDDATPGVVVLSVNTYGLDVFQWEGRVIEATGSVGMVDGERVELQGYVTIPGMNMLNDEARDSFRKRARTRNGPPLWITHSSVESGQMRGFPGLYTPSNPSMYLCRFLVSLPREYKMSSVVFPTLRQLPWGEPIRGHVVESGRLILTEYAIEVPVGEPAELRLHIYDTRDWAEQTIPAREGETLALERNRLFLAKMYPWRDQNASAGIYMLSEEAVGRGIPMRYRRVGPLRLEFPMADSAEGDANGEAVTTVVFSCFNPWGLDVGAVLRSGETVEGERRSAGCGWLVYRIPAEMSEIEKFVIQDEPEGVEVLFRIPKLQGFPAENHAVTDCLDVLFSEIRFVNQSAQRPLDLLRNVLRDRFYPEWNSGWVPSPGPHENVMIRDLLNTCYPSCWWVKNGVVYTTNSRFGPILWRVKEAMQELREGQP